MVVYVSFQHLDNALFCVVHYGCMFQGKVSWNVVIPPEKPRPIVLVALLVVLGGLSLYFWLAGSSFAAVLFILFGVFLVANHFIHEERSVECELNSHSIHIGGRAYHYSDFSAFAFAEPDRFMLRKTDSEDTVALPVHSEDAEEVWNILNEAFEEYRYEPSATEVLTSWLHS